MPKRDIPAPNPPPPVRLDDRPVMALGVLGFGLTIPWLTGLFGPLTPRDGMYWLGTAAFGG